ncbi:DUF815 domain-containing protein [Hippea sp. KM1]|uniref:DUF815 domain-containing protein n=1 Tax=Hippea sp. KM1 TaxID=944481 RepID=UPI00046D0645|nr:DUF815 domain-containing protein [Hippea sp. KM1]
MNWAFVYRDGKLKPVINFSNISTSQLIGLDAQILLIRKNIEAFIANKPFLNMLLWGERGCGKSSLIKAFANEYHKDGLKIVQVKYDNSDLYELYEYVSSEPFKFILFFDDISFDHRDDNYRQFKSMLEGGLEEKPDNVMFVATSNKRHLVKDSVATTDTIYDLDEINEQMSLYGRFGLVVSFRSPDKETYLKIVKFYMDKYEVEEFKDWQKQACAFATSKGARNGRIAKQFVISHLLGL